MCFVIEMLDVAVFGQHLQHQVHKQTLGTVFLHKISNLNQFTYELTSTDDPLIIRHIQVINLLELIYHNSTLQSKVGTHEIGHALGLRHTSVRGSTMWPAYVSSYYAKIGNDDRAGIQSLYGSK